MCSTLPFPCQKDILLKNFSTFGIGGPAKYFSTATRSEELQQMLRYCYQAGMRYFILGKGSNCLFDDRGFEGLVILNRVDFLKQQDSSFHVGGGYSFARLGSQTARNGWTGLEFAAGIPASIGGAVYMNAGANGSETANILQKVLFIKENGDAQWLKRAELSFAYRFSSFQKQKGAISEVIFELISSKTAKTVQKQLLSYRLKTQPYGEKSAGCVFRNLTSFSAGSLIDRCGLKGLCVGEAEISTTHANFIVNKGKAKTQDILDLIKLIKDRIFDLHGLHLEEEIRLIPYKDE